MNISNKVDFTRSFQNFILTWLMVGVTRYILPLLCRLFLELKIHIVVSGKFTQSAMVIYLRFMCMNQQDAQNSCD